MYLDAAWWRGPNWFNNLRNRSKLNYNGKLVTFYRLIQMFFATLIRNADCKYFFNSGRHSDEIKFHFFNWDCFKIVVANNIKFASTFVYCRERFYPAWASLPCHVLCSAQGNREYETRLFVGVLSKHLRVFLGSLRQFSEIFGHLWKLSVILGKCPGAFVWPSEQFWKLFGNLRKIIKNALMNWLFETWTR